MPRHNFSSLSSQDFEELVRDLLQAEWDIALEAFKTGRDSGIDLRYAPADDGATIIQCKHYVASGFSKLLSYLRNIERPKIERLRPKRYVVVTSVGLTPDNKDEIVQALHPFVRAAADVIGAQDIEGLLSRHPNVERANFKLWLTSTSVLERVIHNAELCQTEFEVERIRRKLPLFVQHKAFPRAADLLEETRIVIISGVPGIGKTTLAEMLLYAHLEQGYQPVVVKTEIAEAKKLFKSQAKQIFYYDDFLGQTFLGDRREYLGRNEDVAIVDFMEMVRHSKHARFILTTREHILKGALQISERLAHSPVLDHRCVLELRDYSHGQKARILYNHLYFSNLPQAYKDTVLQDSFFLTVIKHEHFNPRLIEWLSSQTRLRDVKPSQYQAHILGLLESPDSIWAHAFQSQISQAARHVLLSFYTLGQWIEICDLEPAFTALHRHAAAKYSQPISPGDFRKALEELDGAFLSYSRGHASYLNPSIREFVASVIAGNPEIVEDLILSAVRFRQLTSLWQLSEVPSNADLAAYLGANLGLFAESLARVLHGPTLRWVKMSDGSKRGYFIDAGEEGRIEFLMELADAQRSKEVAALAIQAASYLMEGWKRQIPEFTAVIGLLKEFREKLWFITQGGRETYRALLDGVFNWLNFAGANDWLEILAFPDEALEWTETDAVQLSGALERYLASGADDERSDCTTLDELSELRDSLDQLAEKFGLDLARQIRRVEYDIAERDEFRDEDGDRRSYSPRTTDAFSEVVTDEDIAQMFSTLRDGNW